MVGKKNTLDLSSEVLAGSKDGEQGHIERLNRYAKAKAHQLGVIDYILTSASDLAREAEQMEGCSHTLIFRNWYTVNKYRLIGGCTCKKHLLCAMCALRRSAKTVREVEKKVKAVLAENPHLIPVLITFTVKNESDLSERYNFITSAKRKLLQSRRSSLFNERLKNKSITRFIHGSFGSYEFKKGSGSGDWHPHSHEIALLEPVFDFTEIASNGGRTALVPLKFKNELIQEWINLTGDGSWSVDVKQLIPKDGQTLEQNLINTICEASKYALKLNDIEISDQIHAYRVLKCRRLTFSYGSLWGIKIPDDLNDDIESELELLPYIDMVLKFYSGQYNHTENIDLGSLKRKAKNKGSSRLSKASKLIADKTYIVKDVKKWIAQENPTGAKVERSTPEEILKRQISREEEKLLERQELRELHNRLLPV